MHLLLFVSERFNMQCQVLLWTNCSTLWMVSRIWTSV